MRFMPSRLARRFQRSIALLCLLVLGIAEAQATPRQWIERLGVDIRRILEDPKATRTPADAEQAVADAAGNTPWMQRAAAIPSSCRPCSRRPACA